MAVLLVGGSWRAGPPGQWVTMTGPPLAGTGGAPPHPHGSWTPGEKAVCEASGATAAAIAVASIIVPEVPILPERCSRTTRARRELEPRGPEPAAPPAPAQRATAAGTPLP